MYKKGLILLSGLFLLAACGEGETTEPETNKSVVDTEAETETGTEKNNKNTETNNPAHTYDNLVNETTFTEEYGLQAWEDYQVINEDVTFGEITLLNEEVLNYEALDGTTKIGRAHV